jgi:hypothetical protein
MLTATVVWAAVSGAAYLIVAVRHRDDQADGEGQHGDRRRGA